MISSNPAIFPAPSVSYSGVRFCELAQSPYFIIFRLSFTDFLFSFGISSLHTSYRLIEIWLCFDWSRPNTSLLSASYFTFRANRWVIWSHFRYLAWFFDWCLTLTKEYLFFLSISGLLSLLCWAVLYIICRLVRRLITKMISVMIESLLFHLFIGNRLDNPLSQPISFLLLRELCLISESSPEIAHTAA